MAARKSYTIACFIALARSFNRRESASTLAIVPPCSPRGRLPQTEDAISSRPLSILPRGAYFSRRLSRTEISQIDVHLSRRNRETFDFLGGRPSREPKIASRCSRERRRSRISYRRRFRVPVDSIDTFSKRSNLRARLTFASYILFQRSGDRVGSIIVFSDVEQHARNP